MRQEHDTSSRCGVEDMQHHMWSAKACKRHGYTSAKPNMYSFIPTLLHCSSRKSDSQQCMQKAVPLLQ